MNARYYPLEGCTAPKSYARHGNLLESSTQNQNKSTYRNPHCIHPSLFPPAWIFQMDSPLINKQYSYKIRRGIHRTIRFVFQHYFGRFSILLDHCPIFLAFTTISLKFITVSSFRHLSELPVPQRHWSHSEGEFQLHTPSQLDLLNSCVLSPPSSLYF